MNGDVLRALTGGSTLSSTSFFAPALAEGWLDEKAFIAEGWRDDDGRFLGTFPDATHSAKVWEDIGGGEEGPSIAGAKETAKLDFVWSFADGDGGSASITFGLGDPGSAGIGKLVDGDEKQMIGDPHMDEKRIPRNSGGEHDIQTTDWDMIYPDGWVGGGGGTGPYAMGGDDEIILGHDPKDGDVTFGGGETVRGGSGNVIYTEFVAGWPINGDVNAGGWGLRAELDSILPRTCTWPSGTGGSTFTCMRDTQNEKQWAELDFIYKGDALVDGGSFLAYPIPRLAGGDGPTPA